MSLAGWLGGWCFQVSGLKLRLLDSDDNVITVLPPGLEIVPTLGEASTASRSSTGSSSGRPPKVVSLGTLKLPEGPSASGDGVLEYPAFHYKAKNQDQRQLIFTLKAADGQPDATAVCTAKSVASQLAPWTYTA